MLKIYTAHIGYSKGIDITVRSGHILSPPSMDMVYRHKAFDGHPAYVGKYDPMSDEEYHDIYLNAVRERWKGDRKPELESLITSNGELILKCFCPIGKRFCHRDIAVNEIILPLSKHMGVVASYMGTLPKSQLRKKDNGQLTLDID